MSDKAQDYGEPWKYRLMQGEPWIEIQDKNSTPIASTGRGQLQNLENTGRILDCINALKGCPDPEAFVEAVRKQYDEAHPDWKKEHPESFWLRKEDKPNG